MGKQETFRLTKASMSRSTFPRPYMIKLVVADLVRSAAFYEQIGFTPDGKPVKIVGNWLEQLYGILGKSVTVQLMAPSHPDGLRLELLAWSEGVAGDNTSLFRTGSAGISLTTDDLDRTLARLVAFGGRCAGPPVSIPGEHPLRLANIADPDGFTLQLVEHPQPGT